MDDYIIRRVSPWDKSTLAKIFKLRYQVYVNEKEFLSAANYPDCQEQDIYDMQSIHFAAITPCGEVVGALRLIVPGRRELPIEKNILGNRSLYHRMADADYAEVSRLAISKQFLNNYASHIGRDNRRPNMVNKLREVSFGICKSAALHSWNIGIKRWYAFMETSLWRLLAQNGFHFTAMGEQIDYFGMVTPYSANVETFHRPIQTYQQRHEICNSPTETQIKIPEPQLELV